MDLSPITNLAIANRPGIYAFRHKIDGKIYVGQSKDVRKRRKEHEGKTSSNARRFHNALKFHGVEAFDFFVLEYCEFSALDEREIYWISHLGSLHPKGYNLKSGGGALHEHHSETKAIMSANQKARFEAGEHLFASPEFQQLQASRQRQLVEEGLHPTQDPDVQAKRSKTVQALIEKDGKFFSHTPDTIENKRLEQQKLYDLGLGRFQDAELILSNKQRVQEMLEKGLHFSQREGWSAQARLAATDQMKMVCLAIRTPDGRTDIVRFESLHAAQSAISIDRSRLSAMAKSSGSCKCITSTIGLVIKACFGDEPNWDVDVLANSPTSCFLKSIPVLVTVELDNGERVDFRYLSQHGACADLGAQLRAFRWIIKGEKYKSTGCRLGWIVKVIEVEPTEDQIEQLISIKKED